MLQGMRIGAGSSTFQKGMSSGRHSVEQDGQPVKGCIVHVSRQLLLDIHHDIGQRHLQARSLPRCPALACAGSSRPRMAAQ